MWTNVIIGTLVLAAIPFLFAAYGGHLATEVLPPEKRRKVKVHFWMLFFVGLALTLIQQYRSESAQQIAQQQADAAQHRNEAVQNQVQAELGRLVQQGQSPYSADVEHSKQAHTTGKTAIHGKPSRPISDPIAAEVERRRQILNALRNEYILSHDNISAALMAGTEYPPTDWMNERLRQLGERWRFNATKDEMIRSAYKVAGDLSNCGNELMDRFEAYEHLDLDSVYPQYHECVRRNFSAILLKRDMLAQLESSCGIRLESESLGEAASKFDLGLPGLRPEDVVKFETFNETLEQELRSLASNLQSGKCPQSS